MDSKLRQASRNDNSRYFIELLRAGELSLQLDSVHPGFVYPMVRYILLQGHNLFFEICSEVFFEDYEDGTFRFHPTNVRYSTDNFVIEYVPLDSTVEVYWDKTFEKKELPPLLWHLASPLVAALKKREG